MKATLSLEYIGASNAARIKGYEKMFHCFGRESLARKPPWVAEIIGRDPEYKFKRRFLEANRDYSKSSSTANRGVCTFGVFWNWVVFMKLMLIHHGASPAAIFAPSRRQAAFIISATTRWQNG